MLSRKGLAFLLLVFSVVDGFIVIPTSFGKVRGLAIKDPRGNDKYVFKSVPFAKPPLGKYRFALPQDPEPWDDIKKATEYSAACMSNSSQTTTPQKYVSEDCLYVNIFTSKQCLDKQCPVIVYYHGGAFNLDSATMFPDRFIIDRYVAEGVVFAIPAFRLGVFGQLYFGQRSVLRENLFMFDVVKSLNFVHNEIHNFGGDPDRVTVMGHSSGGTIVDALGFSSIIDPGLNLFQKTIVLSAPGLFAYPDVVVQNSFTFAEKLNCYQSTEEEANIPEILNCLRRIDGFELLRTQRLMEEQGKQNFRGIIRGAPFMEFNGKIADLKRNTPKRKMIYGVTENEFRTVSFVNPYIPGCFLDYENPIEVSEYFIEQFADHWKEWANSDSAAVFVSAATYSKALTEAGGEVYLFETRQKPYSFHVSDMQYFIGLHREVLHEPDMDVLDTFYSKLLVNFTKFDVPSPEWETLDPVRMNFLALEVDTTLHIGPQMMDGFHRNETDLWLQDMVKFDKSVSEKKKQQLRIGKTDEKLPFASKKKDIPTLTIMYIVVVTTSYGKVRGITDFSDRNNHKYMFKAIPFAKPPIGKLRFALPENPDPWQHVLDASQYSPACLSNSSVTFTPQSYISEDCLYLNIFTSEKCLAQKCPVIVYYHGGSFNLDSATMFPDSFILERYVAEGVVFVIPAFRLGVFGQFYLGETGIIPANLLIYDCLASLNFVNKEIENFGGKSDDITLMGHSSGGSLVDALGFSSLVDPQLKLFQKMIVLSSHSLFGFADIQINNSIEISRRLGCSNATGEGIVSCMQKLDARDILQTQKEMEENDHLFFKSIIRAGPIMKFNERIADFKQNAPARKLLCGVTEYEFEKFKYNDYYVSGSFLDFENPIETVMTYRNNFTNLTSATVNSDSSSVFVSAATYSEAIVNAGGEVYLFETRQKPYSMHVSDMQYFIGIHREAIHTSDMDVLDSFYSKMLVNFTKFGEPSPNWEKLNPAKMNFLALEVDSEQGIGPKMEDGFHEELVDFWMIDMMELDRNITEQKKNGKVPVQPSKVPEVPEASKIPESSTTTTVDTTIQPQTESPPVEEGSSVIYQQCQRIVSTSFGELEGKTFNGNRHTFKHVPYAKPPIGDLRFRLAEWTEPWNGLRNASEYGPACPSNTTLHSESNYAKMSEDCLHLNVFTNEYCLTSKTCTTIIYYHGGGVNLDNAIMFNDTFIFERYVDQNIVFVIPAYRLGILGLFYLGDDNLVPHNLAIHDCKLALRFIHQEISHFGGNPNDINLMGHSAGAHIALVFAFSRSIDPNIQLFKKSIVISAPPCYDVPELLIKNCYDLAARVGCYARDVTSNKEVVECLRGKGYYELIQMQRSMEEEKNLYFWNFMKGEPFMRLNESIADFKRNAVAREIMIGNTVNEVGTKRQRKENPTMSGSFMDWENPYEVADMFNMYHDNSPEGTVYQAFTEGIFVSSATYSEAMVNAGGKVFLFQSNQQPKSSHVSDMQYFIGMHREDIHTPDMDIMDTFYSQMIINFTKYGNPSPNWKPLNPAKMNYYALEVDTARGIWPKMEEKFHESDVNFWYINMTAFDKEVTRQKMVNSKGPMHPGPVILASSASHESWWFYALIVVVALIIFYLIYAIKRTFFKSPAVGETTVLLK
ncbi:unnamed protein product [Caenorhabditis sp. 36 PRJEB53466]|nr:unnamed protein product [Caenorhabditis sp. 36 PRJEB53466]